MSKALKILILLFVASAAAYAAGRGYSALTDGFSIANITYSKPYDPRWEVPQQPAAEDVFSQKYRYLSKGHQSFVFESEDGRYVIKFLKCHLVEIKPWLAWLPLAGSFEQWREGRINAKQKRLDAIFAGWKIAYEEIPNETGVLAVHMNNSDGIYKPLAVTNKAGWKYDVDLDKSAFLVQRKVDMLLPTIDRYMSNGQGQEAERLLYRLLSLYGSLCERGISDVDPQIMRNTGVRVGQPILIDVGRLKHDARVRDRQACAEEIFTKTRLFSQWLRDHHPSLAVYLDQQLAELRSSHVSLSD